MVSAHYILKCVHCCEHNYTFISDNLTYGAGFSNPGALDASYNTYDETNLKSVNTGEEGNYYELAESTFSNTYESVTGPYSEVMTPHKSDMQARTYDIISCLCVWSS